ncbi:hypothetical protein Vadar_031411 [Vaccinium darrowii]|uniref:Uncharacterized protein n=1 Tax=Vaccinium darrowii TaxID=229202 RepID=A0ACB7XDG6_9ERIC|nr:hypothetical protein Vadar_031411 [Vaccinium darrowii]
MANQPGHTTAAAVSRDYRKGNWTLQETMVLIEAKKMDDERRMKKIGEITTAATAATATSSNKPAELRWKWVEDYCWRNGCWRSQNQCNDKWDNLMRDFKKVRDYERKLISEGDQVSDQSYWKIDKHERKERSLPSNMLPEIFQALVEVVERREGLRVVGSSGGGGGSGVVEIRSSSGFNVVVQQQQQQPSSLLPPLLQYPISSAPLAVLPVPPPPLQPVPPLPLPPPPPVAAAQPPHGLPQSHQPLPTVDSDTSEPSDSPAKRRRKGGGEGTSGGSSSNISAEVLIGTAISKSAAIIAEAIQACEEREEKRHRDLMSLQQRRLQIEESQTEVTKQGIHGLVEAINKLANSIIGLASNSQNNQNPPPK